MSRALATAPACFCLAILAGCTTPDVLEPSAMVGPAQATAAPVEMTPSPVETLGTTPPAQPETPGTLPASVAAIPAGARVGFAPVIGGTVEAVTPLTERLMNRARERGISLAGSGDPATTHMLKGYLSAITDDRATTVIYVWDVLDPSGNRVHRIQGQVRVDGRSGEGWRAVPADAMRSIGDATIDAFAVWLGGQAS